MGLVSKNSYSNVYIGTVSHDGWRSEDLRYRYNKRLKLYQRQSSEATLLASFRPASGGIRLMRDLNSKKLKIEIQINYLITI